MVAAFVVAVALTAPAGFTENATLNARASWVAQKPVHVYCATSDAAWQQFVSSSGDTMSDPNGVTIAAGDSETYLSRSVCAPLLARLHRRPTTLEGLGAAIEIVAHESFHMRGDTDEGQTECDAWRSIPTYLVRWGFRRGTFAYQRVLGGAASYHRRLPDAYHSVC